MFQALKHMLGWGDVPEPVATGPMNPYPEGSAANGVYHWLFCDDAASFAPPTRDASAPWQRLLFGPDQDPVRIAVLAADETAESRVRALAYGWLRGQGRKTPKGIVLGVIVEVPVAKGLDVLAAYADGSVRYINHSQRMVVVEPQGDAAANREARKLVELAIPVVAQLLPWDKPRLPAPALPLVRLSFLCSDGLYFGQGPSEAMERDSLGGAVLRQAAVLLTLITRAVGK